MKKGFELKQLEWIVFVIAMIILFFSTQTYFGTANYSRIYHIDRYCMLAFLGVSIVANHGVIRYKSKDLLTIKIVILPYIFLFAVSVFFYMTNHISMRLEEIQQILSRQDASVEQISQALVEFLQLSETCSFFQIFLSHRLLFT